MNFLNKLERKYGRYAIQNLPMIMVVLYVVGYVIDLLFPSALSLFQLEPYDILHGQIWRLVTWVIIPPSSLDIFTIIMLYFYFSLGRTLEQTWGPFRYVFHRCWCIYSLRCPLRDDRKPGIWYRKLFQHVLYQHVDLPGICPDLPGSAGYAVFPDTDPD